MIRRYLQQRRERAAVGYLTGLASAAEASVQRRRAAGILCPMQTPGCDYVSCGRFAGGECSTMPRQPRDRMGFLAPDAAYLGPA